jgi:D-threo-aldose 1-dehydrogenase
MRAYEQSLRLGLDRIDVLLIHDVTCARNGADAIDSRFAEAMDGAYRALTRLRRCGRDQAIGARVNEAEMCARFARAGDFDCMRPGRPLHAARSASSDDFLPLAEKKDLVSCWAACSIPGSSRPDRCARNSTTKTHRSRS